LAQSLLQRFICRARKDDGDRLVGFEPPKGGKVDEMSSGRSWKVVGTVWDDEGSGGMLLLTRLIMQMIVKRRWE